MKMGRFSITEIVWFCSIIFTVTSTSLPIRSRQVLFYPDQSTIQSGVQALVPQASELNRVDLNQRSQIFGRIQNPNDVFLVYPNNLPVPAGAQSPNYNEIYPNVNVRPTLNPNAVFINKPQEGVDNGLQPDGDPNIVLISNLRPQQPNVGLYPQNLQPFPIGPGAGVQLIPFNFNSFGPQRPAGNPPLPNESDAELIPDNKSGKPEKIQSVQSAELELVDDEAPKGEKPNRNDGREFAENIPTNPAVVKPGQRFFILNGQPQFMTIGAGPYPQLPYEPFFQGNSHNVQQSFPQSVQQNFPQGVQQGFPQGVQGFPQGVFYIQNGNPNTRTALRPTTNTDGDEVQVFDPRNGRVPAAVNQPFNQLNNPFGLYNPGNPYGQPQIFAVPRQQFVQRAKDTELSESNKKEDTSKSVETTEDTTTEKKQTTQLKLVPQERSRQVFGTPAFLQTARYSNNADKKHPSSGPNPGSINEKLSENPAPPKNDNTEDTQVKRASNAAAIDYARYLRQKETNAKTSPHH